MKNEALHILLADDDEADRFLFQAAFKEFELTTFVNTVNNGVLLMERLYQKDIPLPNLIFLDLNMPLKNGLECLKEIRSSEKTKNIPVAIYSTSSYEKDVEESFQSGANVYIVKPNNFKTLKLTLHNVVKTNYRYPDLSRNRDNFLFQLQFAS